MEKVRITPRGENIKKSGFGSCTVFGLCAECRWSWSGFTKICRASF